MESGGITKNQIVAELARSPHGKLEEYAPMAQKAVAQEPEFLAHLVSWNREKGQIRDSKTALPVLSLTMPEELGENSYAHLALLDPRSLVKAVRFAKTGVAPQQGRKIARLVEKYLRAREEVKPWWTRTALQHRESLKALYALYHIKPNGFADDILFKGKKPKGSVFEAVAGLSGMQVSEAAGAILSFKIPFLVAQGALGEKAKDPLLVMALIEQMSPTELVTNTAMLERLGMRNNPVLRAAFEEALAKAATSKKATLKTSKAAKSVKSEGLQEKMEALQEKQIQNLVGIDGDWLVLGDKSGSMQNAIEASRHIAATLARFVKGKVHLIFFDTAPRYIDATGKTYEHLLEETKRMTATGGTSIGCGLQYLLDRNIEVGGVAIISDCEENQTPRFVDVYKRYSAKLGVDPTVYLYRLNGGYGDPSIRFMKEQGVDLQEFDLRKGSVDYYSLPNLVQTMRTSRYSLIDEIMATPLKRLSDVFKPTTEVDNAE